MEIGQPPTRASYKDLWHAAVGVLEICVKNGEAGRMTGLGEQPFPVQTRWI